MNRFRWGALLLASLLSVAGSVRAAAVTITITGGGGRSAAWDGSAGSVESTILLASASTPYASGPVTATDGASSATSAFTLSSSGLLMEFAHVRTANGGYAYSDDVVAGDFFFGVSDPMTTTISGAYAVTDTGSGDRVLFVAELWNNTSNVLLHRTLLESRVTANESFVVGQTGGDLTNDVQGSTTHLLLPGISYYVNWIALIQDLRADAGDTGATASGYIEFALVPEPSSALLLAVGLAALGTPRARARKEALRAPPQGAARTSESGGTG